MDLHLASTDHKWRKLAEFDSTSSRNTKYRHYCYRLSSVLTTDEVEW